MTGRLVFTWNYIRRNGEVVWRDGGVLDSEPKSPEFEEGNYRRNLRDRDESLPLSAADRPTPQPRGPAGSGLSDAAVQTCSVEMCGTALGTIRSHTGWENRAEGSKGPVPGLSTYTQVDRQRTPHANSYRLCGQALTTTETHPYLGVTLTSGLKWGAHAVIPAIQIQKHPSAAGNAGCVVTHALCSSRPAKKLSNTISAARQLSNTISAAKQMSNTISAARQPSNTISAAKQMSNTISAARQLSNTISAAKQMSNTISAAKQMSNTISAAKQLSNTISAAKQMSNTISAAKQLSNTISAAKQMSNTISAAKQLSNTISAAKQMSNTISVAKQLSNTISAAKQMSNTISVAKQLSNTISAAKQLSNTISAAKQMSNTISVAKQLSNTISAAKQMSNTISVAKQMSNTISAAKQMSNTISVAKQLSNTYHENLTELLGNQREAAAALRDLVIEAAGTALTTFCRLIRAANLSSIFPSVKYMMGHANSYHLLLCFFISLTFVTAQNPTVELKSGAVMMGKRITLNKADNDLVSVDQYLGIRYAEAPLGASRFRMVSVQDPKWSGTQNYTAFGAACMQPVRTTSTNMPAWTRQEILTMQTYVQTRSEDCLFLNIYSPVSR
ncbi:Neuroligin-3, partial [Branchiostoma belcheri]